MKKGFVIAIDGPVAAGKGTIASELAKELQGFYLYTGATYRCLTLYGLEKGIDFSDEQAIIAMLPDVDIDLVDNRVMLNGNDVTETIQRVDVSKTVPMVGAVQQVRTAMVALQREIAVKRIEKGEIIVIEGRDTATVVFPDAALKVFLTAYPEVRASRRLAQLQSSGNTTMSLADVLQSLQKRDEEDTERAIDPLVKDPSKYGYFIVDDTGLSEGDTVKKITEELKKRNLLI